MQQSASSTQEISRWLALSLAALLLCLVLRNAWVAEDAYITLRTSDNFVHGLGLRWNAVERVQSYTHPLWMWILTLGYAITRESFFTTIALGLGTTLLAVLSLVGMSRSFGHALVALAMLCCSRAFVDFSTSGLENPLTHLLVAGYCWLFLVHRGNLRGLCWAAALLAGSRSDAVLVVLPSLAYAGIIALREHGIGGTLKDVIVGFSPYLFWTLFSLFYYGVPFPNTAYAKLNTGIPAVELMQQGWVYFFNALGWDPAIWVGILLGVGATLLGGERRLLLIASGVVLYLAYVVRIGGDFMAGRFLTLPLFSAALLIARSPLRWDLPAHTGAALVALAGVFLVPRGAEPWTSVVNNDPQMGIVDESGWYKNQSSFSAYRRGSRMPAHGWSDEGRRLKRDGVSLLVHHNVGILGFHAGPGVHIVDPLALTDPLLARLPAIYDWGWRIGHFARVLPPGYTESVLSDDCKMHDSALCEYYSKLRLVTRGPLWSWERLITLVQLNLGRFNYLIDRDRYRLPQLTRTKLDALPAAGASAEHALPFTHHGMDVELPQPSHATWIELALDAESAFLVELRRQGEVVAKLSLGGAGAGHSLVTRRRSIPWSAAEQGFDGVRIMPGRGDGPHALGHMRLLGNASVRKATDSGG